MKKPFFQHILIAFALIVATAFFMVSCKSQVSEEKTPELAEEPMEDHHTIVEFSNLLFRSDGFYPGIASEWIQVVVDPSNQKITSAVYWNTSDDIMQDIKLLNYDYIDDEISGYSGRLNLLGSEVGFGMFEDRFNLVHDDERFQEFFLEID
jgi:hypothetical protein